MADATATPTASPGLGSLISSLGSIGSGIINSTAGGQAAQNFQAQGQNAINAQNAYLGTAVGYGNNALNTTGGQLTNSQGYTGQGLQSNAGLLGQAQNYNAGQGIGVQQQMYGNATQAGAGGIANSSNLLAGAQNYLQPGLSINQNAASNLNSLMTPGNNYSAFYNMPGYQFSLQQGQNAINRQAAAGGNLYSTNTMANLGNYTAGAASQNYNNYFQQLLGAGALGANAAGQGVQANLNTGQTQAGLYSGLMNTSLQSGLGQAQSYNQAAGNTLQAAGLNTNLNNQASINPLTAANLQNQDYLNQAGLTYGTGQSVGDIYQNIGNFNAQGTAQNFGGLSNLLGNPNTYNALGQIPGLSNLFGGNNLSYGNMSSNANNADAGLNGMTDNMNANNLSSGMDNSLGMGAMGYPTDTGSSGLDNTNFGGSLSYDPSMGDLSQSFLGGSSNP